MLGVSPLGCPFIFIKLLVLVHSDPVQFTHAYCKKSPNELTYIEGYTTRGADSMRGL